MSQKVKQILTKLLLFSVIFTASYNTISHLIKNADLSKKQQITSYSRINEKECEDCENDFESIPLYAEDLINIIYIPLQNQALISGNNLKLLTNYVRLLKPPPENNFYYDLA